MWKQYCNAFYDTHVEAQYNVASLMLSGQMEEPGESLQGQK